MSISMRLRELLDIGGVVYQHHKHPTAYTARQTAKSVHVPETEMVKTLIVNADGLLRMAVVPADCMLDLKHMKFITRSENITNHCHFKNLCVAQYGIGSIYRLTVNHNYDKKSFGWWNRKCFVTSSTSTTTTESQSSSVPLSFPQYPRKARECLK